MRIAVLADIHGNVLALDAVLEDLKQRGGADLTVNLGDSVSGPLWPRETFERLEMLNLPTVGADSWGLGVVLMLVIGLVVGLLPAMNAMRLNIVDALAGR